MMCQMKGTMWESGVTAVQLGLNLNGSYLNFEVFYSS